jgi:C1A family cysteine protease
MKIDRAFVQNSGGSVTVSSNSQFEGRHAMLIVGFQNGKFIVRNSWGCGWGDMGYCYIDYEDLQKCQADDFWCLHGLE